MTTGAYPLNPSTLVGQVRLNLGDSVATTSNGAPTYAYFSDAEINAFLSVASDDVARATGLAYLQLAAKFAMQGKSIKTDDQSLDTRQRGKDLLEVGQSWLAQADATIAAEGNDFFDIATPFCLPEVGF
jgi:hypothetical protein